MYLYENAYEDIEVIRNFGGRQLQPLNTFLAITFLKKDKKKIKCLYKYTRGYSVEISVITLSFY